MTEETAAVRERAVQLLARAPTWHELRRALDSEGLVDRLGAAGMQFLLEEWHRRAANALNDIELRIELGFWAEGGGYAEHLKGFQAIPPGGAGGGGAGARLVRAHRRIRARHRQSAGGETPGGAHRGRRIRLIAAGQSPKAFRARSQRARSASGMARKAASQASSAGSAARGGVAEVSGTKCAGSGAHRSRTVIGSMPRKRDRGNISET